MTRREDVLGRLRLPIKQAAKRHHAEEIFLVGSVAREEDSEDSDYDFVAHFDGTVGLLTVSRLRLELEELLDAKVDLVPDDCIADHCRGMMADAIRL